MRRLWLLFLLLWLALPARAQDAGPDEAEGGVIYGLISVDNTEVRAGPDFAYPTIGQLPINASVEVIGRAGQFTFSWDNDWVQVRYGDRPGWVYGRLIRTSIRFNRLPVTGMILPRDGNGRVPEVFDLSSDICTQWGGDFSRSGDFMAGDSAITVSFPPMPGASVYSVIVITPTGFRIAFDTETAASVTIPLDQLPARAGTYTWRVVPYWTTGTERRQWQQICPLRTGGTFDKPETDSSVPDAFR
jgi:hypothetical protein